MQSKQNKLISRRWRGIGRRIGIVTLGLLLLQVCVNAWAIVPSVNLSTVEGVPLSIDLTQTLATFPTPDIILLSATSVGGGTVTKVSATSVSYTPATGWIGLDSFQYSVINSVGATEIGTVNIIVGSQAVVGSTPDQVLEETLQSVCGPGDREPIVDFICNSWTDAVANNSPEDLRAFYRSLAPEEVLSQLQLSRNMVLDQASNITKRLAALRGAMKYASGSQLSRRQNSSYSVAQLQGETGGGASSDQILSRNRMSWYINNANRNGAQDRTEFEEGYDFSSNSANAGLDWTLGYAGVVGFAFGLGQTDLELNYGSGDLSATGLSGALYGSFYATPGTYIEFVLNSGYQDFDLAREIKFGTFDDIAKSQANAFMNAATLSFGAEAAFGSLTLSAEKTFSYTKAIVEGFVESGSAFGMTLDEASWSQAKSILVTRASYASGFSWGVINHQLDLNFHFLYKGGGSTFTGHMTASPDVKYEITTSQDDMVYMQLGYGANLMFTGGTMLYLRLDTTQLKDNYWDLGSGLGLRVEF